MSDDTKALIERLQLHPDNKTKGAMQRDGLRAADTIARLEAGLVSMRLDLYVAKAGRDAARLEAMEQCARILEALQQGATLADMVTAIRAAMKGER